MAARPEASSATPSYAVDPLDVELGLLVEAQFKLGSSSTHDLDEFKEELRPVVEGAADAHGRAFGAALLARFELLKPVELVALAGLPEQQVTQILDATIDGYGETQEAARLLDMSGTMAKQASRRFGIPIWQALLVRPNALAPRYLSDLIDRWAGSLTLSTGAERQAGLDALVVSSRRMRKMKAADAELVRRSLLRAAFKYGAYVHRTYAWRLARLKRSSRVQSRSRSPRVRRARASAGSRDPPEPPLPRPSEPGAAGLVVVPAEAAT